MSSQASGNSWTTAGCLSPGNDFEDVIIATEQANGDNADVVFDFTLAKAEEYFGGNMSLVLGLQSSGSPDTHKFTSSEGTTSGERPEIEINYTLASSSSDLERGTMRGHQGGVMRGT